MAKTVQVDLTNEDEAAIAALNINLDASFRELLKNLSGALYQRRQDARLRLFATLSDVDRRRIEDAIDAAIKGIIPTFDPAP